MSYVYLYSDPSRDEPIYVGMDSGKRAWHHLKRKDMHPFVQRLQKMLRESVEPKISILFDGLDTELASLMEQELIAKYGRKDLGRGPLLNLTDGGEGLKNATEETRRKISNANRGRKHTPETLTKMSMAQRGHPSYMTVEAARKISAKLKGRVLSDEHKVKIGAGVSTSVRPPCAEETKAKISAANKGKSNLEGQRKSALA